MFEAFFALGMFGVIFGTVGYIAYDVLLKEHLPMSKRKKAITKKYLLKHIERKRNEDLSRYRNLYPNVDAWNRKELEKTTNNFMKCRDSYIRELKSEDKNQEFHDYVNQNDASVRESRIRELEKENERLRLEQDRNFKQLER